MTYRVLDLFCGGGGASEGYRRAGFEVTGVDINPQPHYPFRFWRADAMAMLANAADFMDTNPYGVLEIFGERIDAIHASPPCQAYSVMSKCRPGLADEYPKLIESVRERLEQIGMPYVIENVEGAPLRDPVTLCGTQFAQEVVFNDRRYALQRHRLFETSFPVEPLFPCQHVYPSFPVYGNSAPGNRPDLRGKGFAAAARKVMGIDWMNREELAESIPPAYTEHVGKALMQHLESTSNREAA